MFGRSETRFPDVAELQRGVQSLDRVLARLRGTVESARDAAEQGGHSAGEMFDDVAAQLRDGAGRFGREAVRMGRRAGELGELSLDRFARNVGVHPLAILGVAIGIGAIIGAARYRHATQNPRPRRRRVAARKGNRK
jgi:hypothetical protein